MRVGNTRYALLILLLLLSFAYWIGGAISVIDDLRFAQVHARAPFDFGFRLPVISSIRAEAKQAGVPLKLVAPFFS